MQGRWRRAGDVTQACECNFPAQKVRVRRPAAIFPMEKGGPANEPAFFTGTVIANFSLGGPNKATRTETDEFLGRIAAPAQQRQHALQHKRARTPAFPGQRRVAVFDLWRRSFGHFWANVIWRALPSNEALPMTTATIGSAPGIASIHD
jgi:hypothetical protein